MELWIRSQEKDFIKKIDSIFITWIADGSYYCLEDSDAYILGKYKTEERALEVLDEIERLIFTKLKIENMDYESADIQVKGQILCNMTKIYQMPQE